MINEPDASIPDLLVVGAGGGLVGALRAAELGLSVLIIEASPHFAHGNNTSMSTAMIPGAGSRWQQELGLVDSPELFVKDIMAKTKDSADPVLASALSNVSSRLVTWLFESVGLPIELAVDFPYPGHSQFRCHTIPGRSGSLMINHLIKKVEDSNNIDILVPARLVDVELEGNQCISTVEYPDGTQEMITSRSLLLATNGFGANSAMVAKYIPEIANATYHGSSESRGDAIRIGEKLQAQTAFLDAYQGHAALTTPYATLLGWATVMHGGFLVNSEGKRFGDETTGYSEYAKEVLAQPGGTAFAIIDNDIYEACLLFNDFRETVNCGALKWADGIYPLAETFGVDPKELEKTFLEVDNLVTSKATDIFGRSHWPHQLTPPFAAAKVTGALFHTQGGLKVDEHARVLGQDNLPIEGLYASGGAAMGISGHGASGYLAGNGLLPALGLAFLAAEHAYARNLEQKD